jgi:helix-turn-helix protein
MRYKKVPVTGREDCSVGAHNFTAISKHQSIAMQRLSLLRWLQERQQITMLKARNDLGIMHPAGCVKELGESGCYIATYWQWDNDTSVKRHKQALYVLLAGIGGAA